MRAGAKNMHTFVNLHTMYSLVQVPSLSTQILYLNAYSLSMFHCKLYVYQTTYHLREKKIRIIKVSYKIPIIYLSELNLFIGCV